MGWRGRGLGALLAVLGCNQNGTPGAQTATGSSTSQVATPVVFVPSVPPPLAPPPAASQPASAEVAEPSPGATLSSPSDGTTESIQHLRVRANFTKPTVVGAFPDAEVYEGSLRAGYRSCFLREVTRDPQAHGALAVSITFDANGKVLRIDTKPTGRLSAELDECCRSRVLNDAFTPAFEAHRPVRLSFVSTFVLLPAE